MKKDHIWYNYHMDEYLPQLTNLFSQYKEIKLVYLFGSQATKKTTPLSDYDFAVYLDGETTHRNNLDIRLELISNLTAILKSNKVDLVVLNDKLDPLLKHEIISKRKILYEKEPYRVEVETAIISQYCDFYAFIDSKKP